MVVEVETDNKNRSLSEIKFIFKQADESSLGESGSVMFQFERVGELEVEKIPEEMALEIIDWGVKDIGVNEIVTEVDKLEDVARKAKERGLVEVRKEIVYRAKSPTVITDSESLNKIMDLIEALEDNEDVVKVYAGFDYQGEES